MQSKGAMLIYSQMQNDHSADAKPVGRISRPDIQKMRCESWFGQLKGFYVIFIESQIPQALFNRADLISF